MSVFILRLIHALLYPKDLLLQACCTVLPRTGNGHCLPDCTITSQIVMGHEGSRLVLSRTFVTSGLLVSRVAFEHFPVQ